VFLVDFAGLPAPAPAVHVVGDRVLRAPAAVGVVVEVGAGVALAVDVAGQDAVRARRWRRVEMKNRTGNRTGRDLSTAKPSPGLGSGQHTPRLTSGT
jgi:hypothetical protein